MTYSLISRDASLAIGMAASAVRAVANPLANTQEILRPSLIPGMLGCVSQNFARQNLDLGLFELGAVFSPEENLSLGVTLSGDDVVSVTPTTKHIITRTLFHLKGIIEAALQGLGVTGYSLVPADEEIFVKTTGLRIEVAGRSIGRFGMVAPAILQKFEIKKEKVFVAEVSIQPLVDVARLALKFTPLNPYPRIERHMSIVVARNVPADRIISGVKGLGIAHLTATSIIDYYCGKGIPEGTKSITLSLSFKAPDRTLTESDIEPSITAIIGSLSSTLGASLR
jgi:phenylalanyl-tRNA synthetase beta chain